MTKSLPRITLTRHGETAWTITGQHTGRADIPLTERGERDAARLGGRLKGATWPHVFVSPLQRARKTCDLAGYGSVAVVDADLVEWDYGAYEGRKRVEILKERPDWHLFRDGCPGGESPADVAARADRVIAKVRELEGDVLLFSSGHFLRVMTARWCGQEADFAAHLWLGTTAVCVLGYEHDLTTPALMLWNDNRHTGD